MGQLERLGGGVGDPEPASRGFGSGGCGGFYYEQEQVRDAEPASVRP